MESLYFIYRQIFDKILVYLVGNNTIGEGIINQAVGVLGDTSLDDAISLDLSFSSVE